MRLLKKTYQAHPRKTLWIIWLVLALSTTASLTFMDIALHSPELPMKLKQGETAKWQVWRPFRTSNSEFEMSYRRAADGDLRLNVLGDKTQNITGEAVLMALTLNGKTCTYQQNDVTGWNDRVYRPLEAVQAACVLREKSGLNEWSAQIIDVSPVLQGENTRLGMISPAGSLKNRTKNQYGTMAELLFWGELVWLPFFLFMSLPLILDGLNYLAKQYRWQSRLSEAWQRLMWNLRHKW